MLKNKNGFTLVEIIVSIAIGSIVLMIAGAMILSSSGFLDSTVETDLNKRKIDSIINFVRDEIIYATDVRYVQQDNKYVPDYQNDSNWHYFYVKDGRLYRDGRILFDDGYYGVGKFLTMSIKGYESAQRLDIKYSLSDSKETLYSSRDTVELLNLSISEDIKKEGIYTQDYTNTSEDGYWLFYNKAYKEPTIVDSPEDTAKNSKGTVADQLQFLNFYNNRWEYVENTAYRYGDIVYYNDYWWMKINNTDNQTEKPGQSASHWKRLTAEFESNSYYEVNDVIIYNGEYYRRRRNANWNETPSNASDLWNHIFEEDAKNTTYIPKPNANKSKDDKTIISKLKNIDVNQIPDYIEAQNDKYKVYDWEAPTNASSFVKKPLKINDKIIYDNDGKIIYKFYYRIFNNDAKPGEKSSNGYVGWQEIKLDYDENCAYSFGDIILAKDNGGDTPKYFTALAAIVDKESINYIISRIDALNQGGYNPSLLYSDYINPSSSFTSNNKIAWAKVNN